jgi:hypothetical protein
MYDFNNNLGEPFPIGYSGNAKLKLVSFAYLDPLMNMPTILRLKSDLLKLKYGNTTEFCFLTLNSSTDFSVDDSPQYQGYIPNSIILEIVDAITGVPPQDMIAVLTFSLEPY